jgi:arabinofuranosyltransferase
MNDEANGARTSSAPSGSDKHAGWLVAGAGAVLMCLVVRQAWVAEDAFITLRCVDNWVNGYGLRWNVDERVQAYTHPLWMLALTAAYFVSRAPFYASVALGILTTALALIILVKLARSPGHALAALLLVGSSRSFVDFSTSGLENPLCHALLALFVWQYTTGRARFLRLVTIAALLALNRLDALLVVTPALLEAGLRSLRERGVRATVRDSVVGAAPCLAWELFSIIYYGFLLPNTAYAKLNTAIPHGELVRQGIAYTIRTIAWDLPVAIGIGLGVGVAIAGRRLPHVLLAAGLMLYVAYVVRIGGDFMLGRFYTLPLMAAGCLVAISTLPLERPLQTLLFLLPFTWLLWHPSVQQAPAGNDFNRTGLVDERAMFRGNTLAMYDRFTMLPTNPWVNDGRRDREAHAALVFAINIGMRGFYGGPAVHYVDTLALTEPLLARLPARFDPQWRVGHYQREVPEGYARTLEAGGRCALSDRALCTYHEKLREIVAGEIWSWHRFATIAAMNLGRYEALIDRDHYRSIEQQRERVERFMGYVPEHTPCKEPLTCQMRDAGIELSLGRVSHARQLLLMLDGNDAYDLVFERGSEALGTIFVASLGLAGLQSRNASLPASVSATGFDRLLIRPVSGDGHYAVAYVRLNDRTE